MQWSRGRPSSRTAVGGQPEELRAWAGSELASPCSILAMGKPKTERMCISTTTSPSAGFSRRPTATWSTEYRPSLGSWSLSGSSQPKPAALHTRPTVVHWKRAEFHLYAQVISESHTSEYRTTTNRGRIVRVRVELRIQRCQLCDIIHVEQAKSVTMRKGIRLLLLAA